MAPLFRLTLVFAFLTIGFAHGQEKKTQPPVGKESALDLTFKGELKADDPKDKVTKNPFKVHEVKLRGGQGYIITLDAADVKELDPFLRVEDSAGKELAQDDDSGGFPNAKIAFLAPKDDTYKLIATPYKGVGAYSLRVKAGTVKIYEVAKDGLKIEGKITKTDPPLAGLKGAPHQVFLVKLQKAQNYVVDLMSKDFDAFLIIQDEKGKVLAYDDDGGGGLNSRLNWQAPADGVYRVLTASLDKKPGEFVLRVRAGILSEEDKLAMQADKLNQEGVALFQAGKGIEAIEKLKTALAMREKLHPAARFPEGHPDLASSLNNLGAVLRSLGQASKALPYWERALAMNEKLYPPARFPDGHPHLAGSLNNLGVVLESLGQESKALIYYERALAMREKLYAPARFPEGHPELGQSLNSMGYVLLSLGQASKALPYCERALAMAEKLYSPARFPDGHPDLAISLKNLGSVLESLGQTRRALPYYERALAMREKLYPPARFPDGHRDLAVSLNNLGSVLVFLDQARKALPYCERALAMFEKLYPPAQFPDGHSELAASLRNLGIVLRSLGQGSKALPYSERALAMNEKLYPPARFPEGQPDLAASLGNLGNVLRSLGQGSKALPYCERALAMREKLYPPARFSEGHRDLAASLGSLGAVLHSLGQANKALMYFERALAMNEKLYPPARFPDEGHPDLAVSLTHLGVVLHSLGQASKALPYCERALAMNEKLYPPARFPEGHPDLAMSLGNLGNVLDSLGQANKALPYCERALAMREKLYPPERFPEGHPDLAKNLSNLCVVLHSLGQSSRALPYCERALAMREKLYPPARFPEGHPDLAASLSNLGLLLHSLGQPSRVLPYNERALAMQRGLLAQGTGTAAEADALDLARSFPRTRDGFLFMAEALPDEPARRFYGQLWESKAFVTRIFQARHQATRVALLKDETAKKTWDQLQALRQELGGLHNADPDKVKDRDELVRELTNKKEKLEAELAKALPELERPKLLAKLGPKVLAGKLPKDAVLLDFIRYKLFKKGKEKGRRYVVFIIAPARDVEMVFLKDARQIDKLIAEWREAIERREASKAPEALAKLIWHKIAPHLPKEAKTLYIAPDGDLTRLPFAALPGSKPGTVLLEDYVLVQVPHAPFLLEQLLYPPDLTKTSPAMLAVGDVRYGLGDEARPWPALEATGPEIAQIAKLAAKRKVHALTGGEATVANALKHLPEVGYAHFATHGFFEEKALADERKRVDELLKNWEFRAQGTQRVGLGLRNPLSFTGLVMAGANGGQKAGKDGGILSSEAIVALPLEGLRLAVLSACETGLGELTEGEGVQGLQRAFHLAGCPNVIGSLWKVNDRATAALMNQFYHELWVNKKTPAEALRIAQLRIHRSTDAEMIAALAGERGRPALDKALRRPETSPSAGQRADTRLWAAFVLSGLGK